MKSELREALRIIGRRGGLKGGRTRADMLTPEERRALARKGGRARVRKARRRKNGRFA